MGFQWVTPQVTGEPIFSIRYQWFVCLLQNPTAGFFRAIMYTADTLSGNLSPTGIQPNSSTNKSSTAFFVPAVPSPLSRK